MRRHLFRFRITLPTYYYISYRFYIFLNRSPEKCNFKSYCNLTFDVLDYFNLLITPLVVLSGTDYINHKDHQIYIYCCKSYVIL